MGCTDVISPPESPKCCGDGGVFEPQVLLVHHISRSSRDNKSLGRLTEKSTISSNEWLIVLHN